MNVPMLRFPEFSGEWEEKRLGAIAPNPSYGLNASAIPFDGVHKYIRITDIDEDTRQFIASPMTSPSGEIGADYKLEFGDVLFARTGASTGKSYLYKQEDGNVYYAGFLIRFRVKHADAEFVFAQTLRRAFELWITKMSMRSGQPGVNAKEFSSLTFATPSLPEQKKIAAFLGVVDAKIAALRVRRDGLERYKRGLMQALFSQTLRFTKPDGTAFPDWEEADFEDVFFSVPTKSCQILSSEINQKGAIQVIDQGKAQVAGFSDLHEKTLKNDGAIVFGDHTTELKFVSSDFIVGADGTKVLRSRRGNLLFLYFFLRQHNVQQEGYKRHFSILKQMIVTLPHPGEQQKIADALSAMDAKIAAVAEQVAQMETFKKGLLQQMFV